MSFRIKSSHKFVNSMSEDPPTISSFSDFTLSSTSKNNQTIFNKQTTTPKTSTDTNVTTGSEKGMAVRTSITAMADYF